MADATLELQAAIVGRLKAASGVVSLVSVRVYDEVPDDAPFPYISIGPTNEVNGDADCIVGSEVSIQIDGWSRDPGSVEARRIAHAVRVALTGQEFNLPTNALSTFEYSNTRVFRDSDGLTTHAVVTFTAFVEANLSA